MPWPSVAQQTLTSTILNPYQAMPTNPIINGGFEIWQRGTTFAGNLYAADRWITEFVSSVPGVWTISQSTDVPAVASLVPGTNYSLLVTTNTPDASIAAGELFVIEHRIEGFNWIPFAQKQFTVGFWVKATGTGVTGTYSLGAKNSGSDRTCVGEFSIGSNNWEYKTVTFPASPAMNVGTWNTTDGIGVNLLFSLMCGSTNTTSSLGTWNSDGKFASTNQINGVGTTSNTFRLWGVTMNVGPTVQPYWPRPFPIEAALCQRYFWSVNGSLDANGASFATCGSASIGPGGTTAQVLYNLPVPMRTYPSFTKIGTWGVFCTANSGAGTASAETVTSQLKEIKFQCNVASGVAGSGGFYYNTGALGTERINWSAEL